jgi:hypothetical protein
MLSLDGRSHVNPFMPNRPHSHPPDPLPHPAERAADVYRPYAFPPYILREGGMV